MSRPDIAAPFPYSQDPDPGYSYPEDLDQGYAPGEPEPEYRQAAVKKKRSVDAWMDQPTRLIPGLERRTVALFLLRLPALAPWIFIVRGWLSLNAKEVLTNTEADVLGTGGEICFFLAVSVTPMITVTGARWIAPLRRWYGIFFALIGISDAATAAIATDFAGGVFGRLAGHTFLLTGLLVVLIAVPLLVTANTPAQRWMGRYWKRLQRMTYIIWGFIVLHLLLLDDFKPFGGAQGDGDPVFHQRFYQAVAISLPLVVLRLPPVRRWVVAQRDAGRRYRIWFAFAPLFALYILGFAFIINEEIFTGTEAITMNPPAN
jgi:DMSO/TMAO reductase YedYZ heme-binding membrane subunit